MATFIKELELKKYNLFKGKSREWLKDIATEFLYVYITDTKKGLSKTFYYRYADKGDPKRKINQIVIGKYPSISLVEARTKANELTTMRERGEDINPEKNQAITFKDLAEQWIKKEQSKELTSFDKQIGRINNHLYPLLKDKNIKTLTRLDLSNAIEKIQDKEAKRGLSHDTSKRAFYLMRKIMDYAVSKGYIDNNPARNIIFADTFKLSKTNNFKAITDTDKLKELLRAFDDYQGSNSTKQALIFGIHTFLRSANVRRLKWQYVDFDKDLIIFPAKEMKLRNEFIMPISKQVKKILHTQKELLGLKSEYVFPSDVTNTKPLSENTLNYAIKRLGFGDDMVFHGLRTTASTLLNENIKAHGLDSEVIELCLDHRERNTVKAIYDRSQRLEDRARLMQWWSNYLDELKE
ncbi:site-specific integrase [Campylobacter sp. RM15925]|uniref:tyrosine-type recombinase/integrase n=1 Tax=Campylobacter sp. RM15925 TaxID=1705724 RepID=UPI0014760F8F|nr:site-specific integrase [Campylobacter sp. RM15925]